jgi:hypothetical protein
MSERLGEVSVPSGTLKILDAGMIGLLQAGEIPSVPAVTIEGLPADRVMAVEGERVTNSRWEGCWDHVSLRVSDAAIASSEQVGEAMVDFARLMFADADRGRAWKHNESIDGQADFVFWGRDAAALAEACGAPELFEGEFGWENLPVDEVVEKGTAAEALMVERGWRLKTDFRPHSHHWALLTQVRDSETESGTIDLDGARVCLFMTSWGDGVFPVLVDRAADGAIVRVRIQLRTEASEANMAAVND